MGQHSGPHSGKMLAIVFLNVCEDKVLSSWELFNEFRSTNDVLYWNLNLSEAVNACRLVGHLHPYTLLIEGPQKSTEDIKLAWTKRLLKFPSGFTVDDVGEVNGLHIMSIPQVLSIPLEEALCYIIYDLNCTDRPTCFEAVCETLARWYGSTQMPPLSMIHATLNSLIRSRQIYHTGYGYSIVTSDKANVMRWLAELPSNIHEHPPPSGLCAANPNGEHSASGVMIASTSDHKNHNNSSNGLALCIAPKKDRERERPVSTPPHQFIPSCANVGTLSSHSEERHSSINKGEVSHFEIKSKDSKSFLSRLLSRFKPRKNLPAFHPSDPAIYPPQQLSPHARLWASAWSPGPTMPSRQGVVPVAGVASPHLYSYNSGTLPLHAISTDQATARSDVMFSSITTNPNVSLDYRRQRRAHPIDNLSSLQLRHSFALGDNHSRSMSPPISSSLGCTTEQRKFISQSISMQNHHRQPPMHVITCPPTNNKINIPKDPFLSPPSTHDSGFNSSRTLLDLEVSEIGNGSGGTVATALTAHSKADMLKKRMGPDE